MGKEKTKKPTGITFSRNGDKLTCTWKIGDKDYGDGQKFEYRYSFDPKKKRRTKNCGKTTKSMKLTIPLSDCYPNNEKPVLDGIQVFIQGDRKKYTTGSGKDKKTHKPGPSPWADKTYKIKKPNNLKTLTLEPEDGVWNACILTWEEETDSTNEMITTQLEWKTKLIKDCSTTDGKEAFKLEAVSGTEASGIKTVMNGTEELPEPSATLLQGSYTRWYAMRAQGPGGDSEWAYVSHVYAQPAKAEITKAEVTETDSGYSVKVDFTTSSTNTQPIDQIHAQYIVTTPAEALTVPAGSLSWEDAPRMEYSTGSESTKIDIDGKIGADECIFVRINTEHDTHIVEGKPKLVKTGTLRSPELRNVETNPRTFMATVTAVNNSEVPDSFLAVYYKSTNTEEYIAGIIPHNGSSVTIQCPDWGSEAVSFGVRAYVGTPTQSGNAYKVGDIGDGKMESDIQWDDGAVPLAPENVKAEKTSVEGMIQISWEWSWDPATGAQISWAETKEAWESTDQPETFDVSNINEAKWYVVGLETGITWYTRVRLYRKVGDEVIYGPWSEIKDESTVSLAEAPAIPLMIVSDEVITRDGRVTCSWAYASGDGTPQIYAEICKATVTGEGITYGEPIAHTRTAQHITLKASQIGSVGHTYYLCVRVQSASGQDSNGWSAPVAVSIANPLSCSIQSPSLRNIQVPEDDMQGTMRTVLALQDMPITVRVRGAGASGTTRVALERAEPYKIERPDGTEHTGPEGETVALVERQGEADIEITSDMLQGKLDDGAQYRLVATVQDDLKQTATARIPRFEVHWSDQAVEPTEAEVTLDMEEYIAVITPILPDGGSNTATCDIYRLSADMPELIVEDAAFGTQYVDPYPAIGEFGGHRIVYKTANGDYITPENKLAWMDLGKDEGDYLDFAHNIIDFNGNQLFIDHNVDLSSKWSKDFKETKYLGGSVQGDWNPAVSRTGSISAVAVRASDPDVIMMLRELAVYPGICHVRTADGSSYAANIDVSEELKVDSAHKISRFELDITRVDPEGYDGLPYDRWIEEQGE